MTDSEIVEHFVRELTNLETHVLGKACDADNLRSILQRALQAQQDAQRPEPVVHTDPGPFSVPDRELGDRWSRGGNR